MFFTGVLFQKTAWGPTSASLAVWSPFGQGYRTACNLAIQKLLDMAVDLKDKSMDEKRSMLIRCAETTLNSKQLVERCRKNPRQLLSVQE